MSLRTRPPLPRFTVPPPGFRVPACVVFSDQEFGRKGGSSYRTTERVEYIGDEFTGRIGSVIVEAGWWRFYIESDFGGQHVDLGQGEHTLGPQWIGRILSFEPVAF